MSFDSIKTILDARRFAELIDLDEDTPKPNESPRMTFVPKPSLMWANTLALSKITFTHRLKV